MKKQEKESKCAVDRYQSCPKPFGKRDGAIVFVIEEFAPTVGIYTFSAQ